MHGLEDQTSLIACYIDNALRPQDVWALRCEQVIEPGRDLAPIDRAVETQADAANIVIMNIGGLGVAMVVVVVVVVVVAMMVMAVVMPMIMVTMFVVDVAILAMGRVEELWLDGDDTL